jgi:hypothetical protein
MPKGTYVFCTWPTAAPQAAPLVAHDAPTALRAPGMKPVTRTQIFLADMRLFWATLQPIDRAAMFAVLAVYALCFCLLAGIVGILAYRNYAVNHVGLEPARQVILDPRSFTPLVHLAVEPLGMVTPTTQPPAIPRATPAAARRPPTIIVIPTPSK